MARVILAMSGGVDSSVAAHLLRQQGHEVIGVFMRHGSQPVAECATRSQTNSGSLPVVPHTTHKQGCCSAQDAEDARRVADQLEIPFYAIDFQQDFDRIIAYFVDEYISGRTPNPCIVCNHWLKFGKLFQYADSVGAEWIATGHYARRLDPADGIPWLCRGVDTTKDQSYVLFGVPRSRLSRMLLPVGEYSKQEIRDLASQLDLRVADKRESQEICFVAPGEHGRFVSERCPGVDTAGSIITMDGQVVGSHQGIERFTIGQRKGLGVAMGDRFYVVHIDAQTREVVIGPRSALARRELQAGDTNWLADVPEGPFPCLAKIRYNSRPAPATASRLPGNRLQVRFDEPCFGVAPGQAVVCYAEDRLLGGGWIE